ncbi:MAG: hypothetical protein GX856_08625 [Gammaproteobacteria bacterium]|jgi:hypothetical protein|nr:hypothetical protein [Gammaproteobacteria bacterium]
MTPIDALAAQLIAAKATEAAARDARVAIEEQLLAHVASRSEGSVTTHGEAHRVTVTYGVTRSVDGAALRAAWDSLPDGIRNVFPVKHGLDLKELRHWQNNNPAEYARYIAPVVTAKPAKPAVKVEPIEAAKAA